jgi:glycosyltransferase involved in cell wall biosynthesis
MSVFIIVPAYNEAARIRDVVERLLSRFSNIVVVNDGSRDQTGEALKSLPIYYCEHAVNLGQGAALKTGTELAIGLGADVIVHVDADGQHRVEDVEKVVAALDRSDADVALGSRFLSIVSNIPKKKRAILRLANLFLRVALRIKISDPQNGLRAFKSSIWPKIKFNYDDFRHCTEILFLIKKNNVAFVEIPVKIDYDEYSCSKESRPSAKMAAEILIDKLVR